VFQGSYQHSIDEKGRTSLPAKYRDALSAQSEDILIATPGYPEKCIWLQTRAVYEQMTEKFEAYPELKEDLLNIFVAGAHEVAVDKSGRVLLPPPLREYAELKDEVVWAGSKSRLQIWDLGKWNEKRSKLFGSQELIGAVRKLGL
jgi:MraZ protein